MNYDNLIKEIDERIDLYYKKYNKIVSLKHTNRYNSIECSEIIGYIKALKYIKYFIEYYLMEETAI